MNNNIMINSNDGGANITTDAGRSWSTQKITYLNFIELLQILKLLIMSMADNKIIQLLVLKIEHTGEELAGRIGTR